MHPKQLLFKPLCWTRFVCFKRHYTQCLNLFWGLICFFSLYGWVNSPEVIIEKCVFVMKIPVWKITCVKFVPRKSKPPCEVPGDLLWEKSSSCFRALNCSYAVKIKFISNNVAALQDIDRPRLQHSSSPLMLHAQRQDKMSCSYGDALCLCCSEGFSQYPVIAFKVSMPLQNHESNCTSFVYSERMDRTFNPAIWFDVYRPTC